MTQPSRNCRDRARPGDLHVYGGPPGDRTRNPRIQERPCAVQ